MGLDKPTTEQAFLVGPSKPRPVDAGILWADRDTGASQAAGLRIIIRVSFPSTHFAVFYRVEDSISQLTPLHTYFYRVPEDALPVHASCTSPRATALRPTLSLTMQNMGIEPAISNIAEAS
jgi:hypothetical protein